MVWKSHGRAFESRRPLIVPALHVVVVDHFVVASSQSSNSAATCGHSSACRDVDTAYEIPKWLFVTDVCVCSFDVCGEGPIRRVEESADPSPTGRRQ